MKKVSRIGLLSVALLLGASAPVQAAPKNQSFFQKHKSKLIAGVTTAAAIGLTVALSMHVNKTSAALKGAGIDSNYMDYDKAVAAVGLLGPLGMEKTLKVMQYVIDKKMINNPTDLAILVTPKIGRALAKYWGLSDFSYTTIYAPRAAKIIGIPIGSDLFKDMAGSAQEFIDDPIGVMKEGIKGLKFWGKK
jgi:hypothetical protein